jgi:L-ribulose-5-phosphate 3-epimerase
VNDLMEKLHQTGIKRTQLALDPLREDRRSWDNAPARLEGQGVSVISGMFGCVGEDYSTLETIKRTGGIAPDSTWPQNLQNIRATAELASAMRLKLVTFHAGFLPHDSLDRSYQKMLDRLRETADIFAAQQIELGLETGQETAPVLAHLLQELSRPNVRVNFDPANMLLYDKGDPVDALRTLGRWIAQVHIKDARRTRNPGAWGEEVVAGTGEVDWAAFFTALGDMGYNGNLVIEREAGSQRIEDIRAATKLVNGLMQN